MTYLLCDDMPKHGYLSVLQESDQPLTEAPGTLLVTYDPEVDTLERDTTGSGDDLLLLTTELAQRTKRSEVDRQLHKRLKEGGVWANKRFELDDKSAERLGQALAMAHTALGLGAPFSGLYWTAADNSLFWIADLPTLQQMYLSLGAQRKAAFGTWQFYKQEVMRKLTPEEALAYDVTAGW